ncbi:MAG: tRNA (adenosine(37)-N6)-threonylcarbamoyltransferase complex ATPase subunit type 1 TsaE [Clostridia bacterium]|nr:tRNA (adenosine(37)-N6)-threonylcarbamoyltransferase complex ATPase subunit type 1 TsaE [Clostridia bacterium]
MKEYLSHSENDTMKIAEEICALVPAGTVVAFSGGMGMGKTAFVRGALKAYGNDSFVSSPTFSLVHDYGGNPKVYHFDMYRVTDIDDLYSTGFFDYLDDNSVLFIEWSENIISALPQNTVFVDITRGENEDDRKITVTGGVF